MEADTSSTLVGPFKSRAFLALV